MTTGSSSASGRVDIRPASAGDLEQWAPLFRAYRDFYRLPPDEGVVERVWAWIHDDAHETNALVAVTATGPDRPAEIVGIAHYRRFARPSTGTNGLWLDDLFTSPGHRGAGVGRALIARVRGIAEADGRSVVRWITAADNTTARGLYDTLATRTQWVTYDLVP